MSPSIHGVHKKVNAVALCYQRRLFQVHSFSSGKKRCVVQSMMFPGLSLRGSIFVIPVRALVLPRGSGGRHTLCSMFLLSVNCSHCVGFLIEINTSRRESGRRSCSLAGMQGICMLIHTWVIKVN